MNVHAGYNIARVMVEAFGDEERSMYVDGSGFRVLNDYGAHGNDLAAKPTQAPCLVGITRDDVLSMAMHPLLPLFRYWPPPQVFFSAAERALLRRAADGHTNEVLASHLGISVSAVKQRWVCIFARMERTNRDFFAIGGYGSGSSRGGQKRDIVLRYVREHP
jgi:hypothetical protein